MPPRNRRYKQHRNAKKKNASKTRKDVKRNDYSVLDMIKRSDLDYGPWETNDTKNGIPIVNGTSTGAVRCGSGAENSVPPCAVGKSSRYKKRYGKKRITPVSITTKLGCLKSRNESYNSMSVADGCIDSIHRVLSDIGASCDSSESHTAKACMHASWSGMSISIVVYDVPWMSLESYIEIVNCVVAANAPIRSWSNYSFVVSILFIWSPSMPPPFGTTVPENLPNVFHVDMSQSPESIGSLRAYDALVGSRISGPGTVCIYVTRSIDAQSHVWNVNANGGLVILDDSWSSNNPIVSSLLRIAADARRKNTDTAPSAFFSVGSTDTEYCHSNGTNDFGAIGPVDNHAPRAWSYEVWPSFATYMQ